MIKSNLTNPTVTYPHYLRYPIYPFLSVLAYPLYLFLLSSIAFLRSTYPSIYLSIHLSIDLSISLSICIYQSIALYLSISISISIFISISNIYISIYIYIYTYPCLSIPDFTYLSILSIHLNLSTYKSSSSSIHILYWTMSKLGSKPW